MLSQTFSPRASARIARPASPPLVVPICAFAVYVAMTCNVHSRIKFDSNKLNQSKGMKYFLRFIVNNLLVTYINLNNLAPQRIHLTPGKFSGIIT